VGDHEKQVFFESYRQAGSFVLTFYTPSFNLYTNDIDEGYFIDSERFWILKPNPQTRCSKPFKRSVGWFCEPDIPVGNLEWSKGRLIHSYAKQFGPKP
jgi:hypothetical protein